jgi:addiction module RelE/StbE family toxin
VRVEWSPLALNDVEEIASFIAQDRPEGGLQWMEEIFTSVQRLQRFPKSGRIVPEVRRESIREVIHGDFRIIYRIEPERVAVLTVRHSRQLTGPEDIPA